MCQVEVFCMLSIHIADANINIIQIYLEKNDIIMTGTELLLW